MSVPRLREAHAHIWHLGRSLEMLDLSRCTSPASMLDAFADRARAPNAPSILLGHGARPEGWDPPGWPSRAAFDRASLGRPALAWCFDYHSLVANTSMLRSAGLSRDSADPPGGMLVRNHEGELTGEALEHAALRVWESVPEGTMPERARQVVAALDLLESRFDEVHDLKAQPWLGDLLAGLDAGPRELRSRVMLFPLVEHLAQAAATRECWERDSLRLGGGKIFVDGTLNSRTAWMLRPYADGRPGHPRGTPMMTPEQIDASIRACDALGLPLAAHAIGDAAVRAVLDSIERVRPRTPGFRIEHAEVIDGADTARFARLGIIASVQPCHLLTDIEALRRGLPDRLDRVLPLRELIDAGCEPGTGLIFGSDVPIVRPDPEDSILAATTRRRAGMAPDIAVAPEQAISEAEAWRCFG